MVVDKVETLGIRGIADGVGSGVSLPTEKDGDVSSVEEREAVSNSLEGGFEHVERELSGSVLEAGAPHVEAGSIGLYVGPCALTLKPLVEDEYQVEVDPNLHGNHLVEAQSVTLAHVETCPLEPSNVELEEGRVNGGVIGGTVYSDVSESSSQESILDAELKTKKKKHVKKKQNHSRPPVPPPGTPTFQKLALAMETSGKRRKAGGSAKVTSSSQPISQPAPLGEDIPGIDLHVVLPVPSAVVTVPRSGIDVLIDDDGEFVPDSAPLPGGGVINGSSNDEEATILLGIQHEVGFTFNNNEPEIHCKLVELKVSERRQNVEVEQDRGDQ
jgi:hypothetical protein